MTSDNGIGTSPLAGKSALVTGGSRGIGAAIVRRLAGDGASVAFTYSTSVQHAKALVAEVEATGGVALAARADSAEAGALERAIDQTVETFGGLDILVNNAGILIRGVVDDYSLDDFDRMVAVNVRAVFVAAKAAVPHLKSGGRIITTGSVVADRSAFAGAGARPRTARYHRERHPARPDRDRYECQSGRERHSAHTDGHRPHGQGCRDCEPRSLSGKSPG